MWDVSGCAGDGCYPDLTGDGKRRAMALIEKARAAGVTAGVPFPIEPEEAHAAEVPAATTRSALATNDARVTGPPPGWVRR